MSYHHDGTRFSSRKEGIIVDATIVILGRASLLYAQEIFYL
ncbi:hypothetical protein GCWU000325_01987 [Alloprevotella tannerae ATCC 51259]|uniref:Uncharacterized protein n=1 Tax=Alloprevotella tannerae ATCC 51259 TaxID=626522 RepID=C9LIC9_9BACT|nr:hypothetical protein GCWU000325_01987 [Alloprevotella tannerae ATCC 51259]